MKTKIIILFFCAASIFVSCNSNDKEKNTTQEKDKNYSDTTKIKQDSAARVNPEDSIRKY